VSQCEPFIIGFPYLRFWRKKRGISQQKLSEMVNISPNYLNAVENGKNFPSPEVIQHISDILELLPYQLFLEHPILFVNIRYYSCLFVVYFHPVRVVRGFFCFLSIFFPFLRIL